MKDRIKKAKEYLDRIFISDDFENPKKSFEILKEVSLKRISCSKKVSLELKPCYEASLLTPQQETQLFRKMNYFKYKAKKLMDKENISLKRLEKIEDLIKRAKKVRNEIAESNFRLATQLLRQNISFYQKNSLVESLLSDAYFNVLKSVDYFDWTRGNKFSTYATWVVKKNFFRDFKEKQKKTDKVVGIQENNIDVESKSSGFQEEIEYEGQKKLINSLLILLKHGDCPGNHDRYVFILENYFGLNGQESHTLEEISQKLNITKERVRQLKEKGIDWLRSKTKEMNLNYESSIESFCYS